MTTLNTPLITANPFKELRQAQSLTQSQIAALVGISKHAVLRNEQGMAVEPLPALLSYFAANFPTTAYELRHQYEVFQISQRANAGKLLGPIPVLLQLTPSTLTHPLKHLRLLQNPPLNPTSLARMLCLNQSVINYFERNPLQQQTVPDQLLTALKQAGYDEPSLLALTQAYNDYRGALLNDNLNA